jgi:hypothetical protein
VDVLLFIDLSIKVYWFSCVNVGECWIHRLLFVLLVSADLGMRYGDPKVHRIGPDQFFSFPRQDTNHVVRIAEWQNVCYEGLTPERDDSLQTHSTYKGQAMLQCEAI